MNPFVFVSLCLLSTCCATVSGGGLPPPPPPRFRTYDGRNNNPVQPTWGSAGIPFLRFARAEYADGIALPPGATRPSARRISNVVAAHPTTETLSRRGLTSMVYAWGQFIDHDVTLTETNASAGSLPIRVPTGDPSFDPRSTGNVTIPLTRSNYRGGVTSPRQQLNSISSFLDASMVYGSDAVTAAGLRTKTRGQMKTSTGLLLPVDAKGFFLAGDIRVNENPELTSLHTLFLREHNAIASQLQQRNPSWNDETVYQETRRRIIAEIQAITFNEWLPALIPPSAMPSYQGPQPNVDPTISNEFAAAAFRFGHSQVGDDIEFLDNDGNEIAPAVLLRDAFFKPQVVKDHNIAPILKYLAVNPSEELDLFLVESLRNFLFGAPGRGGFDLAALNIQRGRDHGLLNYNGVRAACGLPKATAFSQVTSRTVLQQQLQSLYGNASNVDLWVGGLSEDPVPGGSLGPTFTRIIADQFTRLRAGDGFWYEHDFRNTLELSTLRKTRLSALIKRNTNLTKLQDNVFFVPTSARSLHRRAGSQEGGDGSVLPRQRTFWMHACLLAGLLAALVVLVVAAVLLKRSRPSSATRPLFDAASEKPSSPCHVVPPSP